MSMLDSAVRPRRATSGGARYLTRGAAAVAVDAQPLAAPRRGPAERPNHLRVVAPAERTRRRLTPGMAVLLSAAIFVTLLAVAMAQTVLVQGQVRLDKLDAQLADEQARYQELRRDVAVLESPGRIVDAAHQQGMVEPDDLLYLQPPSPDASAPSTTAGAATAVTDGPTVGANPDRAWSEVKPMLEATGP